MSLRGLILDIPTLTPVSGQVAAPSTLAVTDATHAGRVPPEIGFTVTFLGDAAPFTIHAYTAADKSTEAALTGGGAAAENTYTFDDADLNFFRRYWLSVEDDNGNESDLLPILTPFPTGFIALVPGVENDLILSAYEDDAADLAEINEAVYHFASLDGTLDVANADQPTRPALREDAGGNLLIDFAGSSNRLEQGISMPLFADEFYVAFCAATLATGNTDFLGFTVLGTSNVRFRLQPNAGGVDGRVAAWYQNNAGTGVQIFVQDADHNNGQVLIVEAQRVKSPSALFKIWVNNVTNTGTAQSTATLTDFTPTHLIVGGTKNNGNAPQDFTDFDFYALVLYPAAAKSVTFNGESIRQMLARTYQA